jgi:hypothetical protein
VKNKKVKTENKTRRQGTRYSGQEKKKQRHKTLATPLPSVSIDTPREEGIKKDRR